MPSHEYNIDFVDPLAKSPVALPRVYVDGPNGDLGSPAPRSLDINLIGEGNISWGEYMLENMVHLLENFASPELGITGTPDPATSIFAPITPTSGQLWFNTTRDKLYVYNGSAWNTIGDIEVSDGSPPSATTGQFWYDTSNQTDSSSAAFGRELKIYNNGWTHVVDDYLPRDGSKVMFGHLVGTNITMDGTGNVNYWLKSGGFNRGVLYYDATNDRIKLQAYNTNNSINTTMTLDNGNVSVSATTPQNDADLTRKDYTIATFLAKAGGIMNGNISFVSPVSGPSSAIVWDGNTDLFSLYTEVYGGTEQSRLVIHTADNSDDYVSFKNTNAGNTKEILAVKRDLITSYSQLAMSGNKITGLGTPTADADAATRKYVLDSISSFTSTRTIGDKLHGFAISSSPKYVSPLTVCAGANGSAGQWVNSATFMVSVGGVYRFRVDHSARGSCGGSSVPGVDIRILTNGNVSSGTTSHTPDYLGGSYTTSLTDMTISCQPSDTLTVQTRSNPHSTSWGQTSEVVGVHVYAAQTPTQVTGVFGGALL